MGRILLIDSDPGGRIVVRSQLVDQGHAVLDFGVGVQGVAEARTGEFDMVLVSAHLAGPHDSAEVCRDLKSIPGIRSLPVLVYAAQATAPEVSDRNYDAGCEVFLTKTQLASLERFVAVMLRLKGFTDELREQIRLLEQENRRLGEERQRERDLESLREEKGGASLVFSEAAAERPDGILIVDSSGTVLHVDRGACELLGNTLENKKLGSIAPASGLEAFVRDARTAPRSGFRFDLISRGGKPARSLLASVLPVTTPDADRNARLRVVLLLDVGKRLVAEEVLRSSGPSVLRRQLGSLFEAARTLYNPDAIIGESEATRKLREHLVRQAQGTASVHLSGEPGSGKGFMARTLHYTGTASGCFLQIDCSSLNAENLEREIFGCAKGAYEGAVADRPGLLKLANCGTLYLQELAELPAALQDKLIEFLRDGRFSPVGTDSKEAVRVRIIASTTHPLEELVNDGALRPDLAAFFEEGHIRVPSLRDRLADLDALSRNILNRHFGHERKRIEEQAMWVMQQYSWPGNLDELEHCLQEACGRAPGDRIDVEHLNGALRALHAELPDPHLIPAVRPSEKFPSAPKVIEKVAAADQGDLRPWDISDEDPISLEFYEKQVLKRALHSCRGDKIAAARLLKVGKSTLYRKLKRFDIQ